jgi:hypothetical protein
VDQRFHQRWPAHLHATVTDLAVPGHSMRARAVDLSESGLCLIVPEALKIGSIIEVKIEDCTLFGHVIYCQAEAPSFRAGIEVVRVLIGESDLSRLIHRVLAESMPNKPGINAIDAR